MKGQITPGKLSGTWYLRVEVSRPPVGARRRRRETFRGTKAEAQRRLRFLLDAFDNLYKAGITLDDLERIDLEIDELLEARAREPKKTAGELVADFTCRRNRKSFADVVTMWLQATEHRVGGKTYARYASIARLYIRPTFGKISAEDLRPAHVEAAVATWATGTRNDKEKDKLSQRTVAHLFSTLRTICRRGVRMGLLMRNPIDACEPPRVERKEMRALDPAGIAALLAAAAETDLQAPITVAVGTGLRRGELLGLRWSDVDLEAGKLSVRPSVETVAGVTRTKPPKTARSARTVSLAPFVLDVFRKARSAQAQLRLAFGEGRDDDGWIFTRADLSAWEPGQFSLHFARLVKRSKLQHVRFHDLRHTFGTLAITSGVDLQTVSRALGHESSAITSRIYLHAVDALQVEAANRIETLIGRAVGDAMDAPAIASNRTDAKGSGPRETSSKAKTPWLRA